MKTLHYLRWALWLTFLLPLAAQAQYGLLWRVEDKLADKAAQKIVNKLDQKAEAALERQMAEASTEYYNALLADGKIVCHGIQFEPGTATLTEESQPIINALVNVLAENPDLRIRIEGHTPLEGDAAANLKLSQRQAETVRVALVRGGVEASRLTTKGLGETHPLDPDPANGLDSLNQRLELVKL
ncbi:OmpA family protein [Hymenobacter sp. BT730]|uniref:OmpA family protein n=1 Tax=Hymenobacter sp. BT730 TaxID=3063332 RepID=UPI0026E038E7|nr:OmpA family protein [Hymenobacter sp. BT730]